MEEVDDDLDPDNDISYGKSSNGHEVMIVNEREIFHKKKCGKRKLNNSYSISWNCKNTHYCNATLISTRDLIEIGDSDYNVLRNRVHSDNCSISRTDVVVLKYLTISRNIVRNLELINKFNMKVFLMLVLPFLPINYFVV